MKGEFRDRGNIKWTAMMLPEHKKKLVDLEHMQNDLSPPELDEWRIAELAETLSRSMVDGITVKIKYWMDRRHREMEGKIKRIDPMEKTILLEVNEDEKQWIPAKYIIDVEKTIYFTNEE